MSDYGAWKGFVKEMSFKSGVQSRGSDRWWERRSGDCDEVIRAGLGEPGTNGHLTTAYFAMHIITRQNGVLKSDSISSFTGCASRHVKIIRFNAQITLTLCDGRQVNAQRSKPTCPSPSALCTATLVANSIDSRVSDRLVGRVVASRRGQHDLRPVCHALYDDDDVVLELSHHCYSISVCSNSDVDCIFFVVIPARRRQCRQRNNKYDIYHFSSAVWCAGQYLILLASTFIWPLFLLAFCLFVIF